MKPGPPSPADCGPQESTGCPRTTSLARRWRTLEGRVQAEKPIQRPLAPTPNHSANDTTATSLNHNGRTRVSSAIVTVRRIVNVNSIARPRLIIFTQNARLS